MPSKAFVSFLVKFGEILIPRVNLKVQTIHPKQIVIHDQPNDQTIFGCKNFEKKPNKYSLL